MNKYTDENNEASLIRSLKNGSHKAFDKLYQMYARRLYAYSLQFNKSAEESEEIVQDVFIKLWTNREKIVQEDTLRSLLFIMAKHQLINAFRSKLNDPVYEEFVNYKDALSSDNTEYQLEYQDFQKKFDAAMQSLSTTQQNVIRLSRIEQLSNKEISEQLSLSEQTVKNQLSAGLKILRQKLGSLFILYMLLFIN
ncbi:RNA polymerase sigma factor [Prevotella sp. 10(H)]|uniref:RNA polymerase sigma factor n=1 Tax=Prevotella sp. 10(H) TaxID=1158294 RepID=UPI0004A6B8DC|nr:RNA polymerase sigma-70 factor [Prevotella sp. 10(H)]